MDKETVIDIDNFLQQSCLYFEIDIDVLKSKTRIRKISDIRFMLMAILILNTNMTKKSIGRIFRRDHSTVVNAHKRFYSLSKTNYKFVLQYKSLIEYLVQKGIIKEFKEEDKVNSIKRRLRALSNLKIHELKYNAQELTNIKREIELL